MTAGAATVIDAVIAVLQASDRALSAREIRDQILARRLYAFRAKDPLPVIQSQIRRHCAGYDHACPSYSETKYFRLCEGGRFTLIQPPGSASS